MAYYNAERPHRGIGRATPLERWKATPPIVSLGVALPGPGKQVTAVVDDVGRLQVRPWIIHVGAAHAGGTARVMLDDTQAAVFIDDLLVRHFELDHSRAYQPSGLPRGGAAHRVP